MSNNTTTEFDVLLPGGNIVFQGFATREDAVAFLRDKDYRYNEALGGYSHRFTGKLVYIAPVEVQA
jgi:hypothetical protein